MKMGIRFVRSLPLLLLSLFYLCASAFGASIIAGKVTGADGEPPALAHVHLTDLSGDLRNPLQSVEADEKGNFRLEGVAPGWHQLIVTSVDHSHFSISLFIDDTTAEVRLAIQPSPYPYKEQFDDVKIIGDWNGFKFSQADDMERQPDGTFVFEVETEADTFGYQLLQTNTAGRSINGTQADYYVYDNGGDYISVLRVEPGKVKIVFDPQKIERVDNGGLPAVTFDSDNKLQQKIWYMAQQIREDREAYGAARDAQKEKENEDQEWQYDWSEAFAFLKASMQAEHPKAIREYAALQFARLLPYDKDANAATAEKIMAILPPSSGLWEAAKWRTGTMAEKRGDDEARRKLLTEFWQSNPSRVVQAIALADLTSLAHKSGNKEQYGSYYARLKEDYSDVAEVNYYVKSLDPNRRVMAGKQVPDFEFKLIGSEEKVSSSSLKGRYYMMDFWATWCGPCIAEMPELHEAYEKFASADFTLLSLSFDSNPEKVTQFRQKEWKMPWMHAFVENNFESDLAKTFEVYGIPKPVLVGPNGEILAVGNELRGENLEKTLTRFLGGQTGTF